MKQRPDVRSAWRERARELSETKSDGEKKPMILSVNDPLDAIQAIPVKTRRNRHERGLGDAPGLDCSPGRCIPRAPRPA